MRTKLCRIFIWTICFSFIITGCGTSDFKKKSIHDIVRYDNITKIEFYDGRGGINKPFTLEDKEKIKVFLNYLDNYIVKKERNHIPAGGWSHTATFYSGDKEIMRMTFGNPIEINETYHTVIKGDSSPKQIDEFIKSVNPSWNIIE